MGSKQERDPKWTSAVTPEIRAAVADRATEGGLTCAAARSLAEELRVPYQVAGAAADLEEVRIKNCSLGCF
jgi:hypothetical protein